MPLANRTRYRSAAQLQLSENTLKAWYPAKLAAEGLLIPMVRGTADAIQNPFYKALALEVNNSDWICNAMDQLLGRDTGRVFNDEAAAVAIGAHAPEQATKTIENSWSKIG